MNVGFPEMFVVLFMERVTLHLTHPHKHGTPQLPFERRIMMSQYVESRFALFLPAAAFFTLFLFVVVVDVVLYNLIEYRLFFYGSIMARKSAAT